MAITKASEHTPDAPLTVYCSPDDVKIYLAGVAQDDEGNTFESLLSHSKVDEKLAKLGQIAKILIDKRVGHDFDYHEDVEIAVDGIGADGLQLGKLGFVPLLGVSALSVDSTDEDMDDYVVYQDGLVARTTFSSTETSSLTAGARTFTLGRQNVVATVTWGYTSVPIDIEMAAAYWTGALFLNPMDAAIDSRAPGVSSMARSMTYGDIKLDFGIPSSSYYALSERLKKLAKSILDNYIVPFVSSPDPRRASQLTEAKREFFDRYNP